MSRVCLRVFACVCVCLSACVSNGMPWLFSWFSKSCRSPLGCLGFGF